MIASLSGRVQHIAGQQLILDVGGVGYLVSVTPSARQQLNVGKQGFVHISMVVREDAMLLFGFATAEERDFFDSLRGVSGVGPKLALSILSDLNPADIALAVANEDEKAFTKISGIGAKTAKLLIVTLAGRLKTIASVDSKVQTRQNEDVLATVVLALTGLGITESAASEAVKQAATDSAATTRDAILRNALAILGAAKANR